MFAKIVGFGFAFLLPLLVVRFLSQEKVGIYRQVFQVVVNAVALLPLGISMSAYYFLSRETGEKRSSVVFNILIFNFLVGGAVCFTLWFYPQLVGNIFRSEEITRLMPKIGIVIWIWVFSMFLETVAVANQEARLATIFIIFAQFTKMAFMVSAVVLFATVDAFVYAAMLQGAVQTIVLMIYLNSRFPRFWRTFDPKFFREQLFYALPFGLAALFSILQIDIHNYFVSYKFSAAEFAVYAIGCFQLPLIAMLAESINSVLISRMSELQALDNKPEIVRLTLRATQKLAFFYLPVYVFLMITAQTFITTLFTHDYLASVPIFLINLTLMPIYIWVTDPIIRAYRELGRFMLILRVLILIALVAALYFGIQTFDLRGMITIVVVAALTEKVISTVIVYKKLDVKRRDLFLLGDVCKTAVASLAAGFFTFLFYWKFSEIIFEWGANLTQSIFTDPKTVIIDFIAGSIVLGISALIFAPVYLLITNYFDLIDEAEKEFFKQLTGKFLAKFSRRKAVTDH